MSQAFAPATEERCLQICEEVECMGITIDSSWPGYPQCKIFGKADGLMDNPKAFSIQEPLC